LHLFLDFDFKNTSLFFIVRRKDIKFLQKDSKFNFMNITNYEYKIKRAAVNLAAPFILIMQ